MLMKMTMMIIRYEDADEHGLALKVKLVCLPHALCGWQVTFAAGAVGCGGREHARVCAYVCIVE